MQQELTLDETYHLKDFKKFNPGICPPCLLTFPALYVQ